MKKGSETIIIKRSQINFNPKNIKNHSQESIDLQKKNIRKVGALGGIVWNQTTGNLIDGHRRTAALDAINKYDGTPDTDYEIKVEKVDFDEKTEKEQMTYMAIGNSKADFNLIADFIDEIDYKDVGLSEADYKAIMDLRVDDSDFGTLDMMTEGLISKPTPPVTAIVPKEMSNEEVVKMHDEKPKMTREEVKAEKQHCDNVANNRQEADDLFIVLSFDNFNEKLAFTEALGFNCQPNMVIKGKEIMNALEL